MRVSGLALLIALTASIVLGEVSAAEFLPADADGWHTWQVDESSANTGMCCFSRQQGSHTQKGCNLDGRSMSFSDGGDCAAKPGTIQVYVRFTDGAPEDIRVLSSNCVVSTKSELVDHGLISTTANLGWFRRVVEDKSLSANAREEALFGLVITGSDAAYDYLDKLLSQR